MEINFIKEVLDFWNLEVKWENVLKVPEFKVLSETQQNPYWHSEGDVMAHTRNVVEEMYKLCPIEEDDCMQSVGEGYVRWRTRYFCVLAALFHDIGKGVTTKWSKEKNAWTSPNHAMAGERIARRMLWDMPLPDRELICSLVGNHMKPLYVSEKSDKVREVVTLAEEPATIELLLKLKTADCLGSKMKEYDGWKEKLSEVEAIAKDLGCFDKPYGFPSKISRYKYFMDKEAIGFDRNAVDDTDFNVYLLIGLPGAGKTTYREGIKLPIVCRDDIRVEIGLAGEKPSGNKQQEDEVTRISEERIMAYAKEGKSFIIDATNLKRAYRDGFKKMLSAYNPKFIYVYFEAPTFQTNLDRREGQIPKNVIMRMRENFDFPKLSECYELLVKKQGMSWLKSLT